MKEATISSDACIFIAADEDMESLYTSSLSFSSASEDASIRGLDFDLANDDSSIQKQVEKLHKLFTDQDLHMANMDIDGLQADLKKQCKKIGHIQQTLKEKEEVIAKIQLERDLADAERKMLRQQFSHFLHAFPGKKLEGESKDNGDDGGQHVVVSQFVPGTYPCNEWKELKIDGKIIDGDIAKRLLDGWKSQENLHRVILKGLGPNRVEVCLPKDEEGQYQSKTHLKKKDRPYWKPILFLLQKMKGKDRSRCRVIKCLSIKKILAKDKMKYQAIHDDNDTIFSEDEEIANGMELVLTENAGKIHGCDDACADLKLIDEIVSFEQKNRKCIHDAHLYIRTLEKKIDCLKLGATHDMDAFL